MRRNSVRSEGVHVLTARELEVGQHLVSGHRTDRISEELGISPSTVRNHLRSMYLKLNVHSQVELISKLIAERAPSRTQQEAVTFMAQFTQETDLASLIGVLDESFVYREPFADVEIRGPASFRRYMETAVTAEPLLAETVLDSTCALAGETGTVTTWTTTLKRRRRWEQVIYSGVTLLQFGSGGVSEMQIFADLRPLTALGIESAAEALRLQFAYARGAATCH